MRLSRPLRIAHLTQEQEYAPGYSLTKDEITLYRHLPREEFVHTSHTHLRVPPERKTEMRDRFGVVIHDGLDGFQDLVASLRGTDIAIVHHYMPYTRAILAASAACVPVVLERVVEPYAGQVSELITWTVCIARNVLDHQPFPERCSVIYNGIDVSAFRFARPAPAPGKPLVIAQIGSPHDLDIASHRDLIHRCRAAGVEVRAWVVGAEGDSDTEMQFWGWRNDVPSLLRQIDVLVHFVPRTEAFGYQVLEAMASGAIPLVADAYGPGEIVEDGVSGLKFPRGDLRAASERLTELASWARVGATDRLGRLIAGAQRRAEAFDEKRIAAQYRELLLRLVHNHDRPAGSRAGGRVDERSGPWFDLFHFLDANAYDRFLLGVYDLAHRGHAFFPLNHLLDHYLRQARLAPKSAVGRSVARFFAERIQRLAHGLTQGSLTAVAYELGLWALFLNRRATARRLFEAAAPSPEWTDLMLRLGALELCEHRARETSAEGRHALRRLSQDLQGALSRRSLARARHLWNAIDGDRLVAPLLV